jgi:hypothetical protein
MEKSYCPGWRDTRKKIGDREKERERERKTDREEDSPDHPKAHKPQRAVKLS